MVNRFRLHTTNVTCIIFQDIPSLLIYISCEEREYSILLVMSELSTVRCDRALGL